MAEWPVFLVGKTNQPDNLVATVREEIPHPGNGKPVVREVSVRASKDHGYPTERDGDVLVALITCRSGSPISVAGSSPSPARRCGRWWGGRQRQSYDEIVKALYRWMHTKLEFRDAWYRPGRGRKELVGRRRRLHHPGHRVGAARVPKRYPVMPSSSVIASSSRSPPASSVASTWIRTTAYADVQTDVPILRKRFGGRNGDPVFRGDLRKFAVTNMALSPDYNIGQIKEKLGPRA